MPFICISYKDISASRGRQSIPAHFFHNRITKDLIINVFKNELSKLLLIAFLCLGNLSCSAAGTVTEDLNIRINQVGYFPDQVKLGVVFSKHPLKSTEFILRDAATRKEKYRSVLSTNKGSWGNFPYHYYADFSSVGDNGSYILEIGRKKSPVFKIGNALYEHIVDSLLTFLTVQRCGPTNPKLHKTCHLFDSPVVVGDNSVSKADITGGWHDAGDYLNFVNATALTTYMLLLAYEQNKVNLQSDRNHNNVPDILEEARVGLDWLLRCNYKGTSLINQVQDMRDHDQSWRLPENDSLKYDRPAYRGIGKNVIGIYSASLAIASRIWKEALHDEEFSKTLLSTAEKFYSVRNQVPDQDQTNSGMYVDRGYTAKLAIGAVELFKATNKTEYLTDAKALALRTQPDFWWSWGDINALAYFRIAPYASELKDYLLKNVTQFNSNKNANIFSEATSSTWGTTNTLLGTALQVLFLKSLTGSSQFDSVATLQVDYILGRNPWGVSFIYNFGTTFTKKFHSQIAFFNDGYLPGGIAAGPAPQSVLKNYTIKREGHQYDEFNSSDVKYYDERMDFITNEPTIVTNATAILLFSSPFFQRK